MFLMKSKLVENLFLLLGTNVSTVFSSTTFVGLMKARLDLQLIYK